MQDTAMASTKKGITVRFEDDEMDALEELAKRYRVTSATIIRWSLAALNDYVARSNGQITLPLDFSGFTAAQVDMSDEANRISGFRGKTSQDQQDTKSA